MDLLYTSMGENISVEIYFQTTKIKASVSSILSISAKKDVKCYAKQIKHDSAQNVSHFEGMMVQNLKTGPAQFLHISPLSLPSINYLPVPRHKASLFSPNTFLNSVLRYTQSRLFLQHE
jgi:hypothetical protein